MSNGKIQISEARLKDLIKQVWDKINYVQDPDHVVQRLKAVDSASTADELYKALGMNVRSEPIKKISKKSYPSNKIKRSGINLHTVKIPDRISKQDWREGFDLTKPPFYQDLHEWTKDHVDIKQPAHSSSILDYIYLYMGEDLTKYGFPFKPGDKFNGTDTAFSLKTVYMWNRAKAFQIYYEKKIKDRVFNKMMTNYISNKRNLNPNHN